MLLLRFLILAVTIMASSASSGQVIFGADVGDGSSPLGAVFRVANGTVTSVPTGLPNPQFPSLSPAGNLLVVSSPDPAQPGEASTDLFAHDLTTGQTRKLVDNQTQQLPDGTFLFASPLFSGTELTGERVAFVNQLSSSNPDGSGSVRQLSVIRASDGFNLALAEIGQGNAIDFYQSEFVGISWSPNAPQFATPAYVPVTTNTGRQTVAAGIVVFGPTGVGQFGRVGQLTVPMVTDLPGQIIAETHAFPAFSRNGQRLAFFRITFPSVLMTQPAQADLIVINLNAGTGQIVASFNPGNYPLGVSWSGNDQALFFAAGTQVQQSGQFPPLAIPSTAQMFTVSPDGGPIGQIPGAPTGYFPNAVPPSRVIFQSNFEG